MWSVCYWFYRNKAHCMLVILCFRFDFFYCVFAKSIEFVMNTIIFLLKYVCCSSLFVDLGFKRMRHGEGFILLLHICSSRCILFVIIAFDRER
jgi:hypothetical protein